MAMAAWVTAAATIMGGDEAAGIITAGVITDTARTPLLWLLLPKPKQWTF